MPAAKPAQLLLLNGRGENKDSAGRAVAPPPPFRRIAPKVPSWLSAEAKAEWKRVAPGLTRLDLLKEEDRAALAAYCETWATFVRAQRVLTKEGLTYLARQGEIPRPEVAIARQAGKELRAWASQFGLTPAAERNVTGPAAEDDDDTFS